MLNMKEIISLYKLNLFKDEIISELKEKNMELNKENFILKETNKKYEQKIKELEKKLEVQEKKFIAFLKDLNDIEKKLDQAIYKTNNSKTLMDNKIKLNEIRRYLKNNNVIINN